ARSASISGEGELRVARASVDVRPRCAVDDGLDAVAEEAIADRLGLVEVEFGPVPGERTTRTGEGRLVERRHDRAAKAPVRACDGNPHSAELGRGFRSLFGRGLLGRGAAGDSGFVLARVVGVPLAGPDGPPPALVGA